MDTSTPHEPSASPRQLEPHAEEYGLYLNRFKLLNLVQKVAHNDVMELVETVGLDALRYRSTRMPTMPRGGIRGNASSLLDASLAGDGGGRRVHWRFGKDTRAGRRTSPGSRGATPAGGYQPRRTNHDLRVEAATAGGGAATQRRRQRPKGHQLHTDADRTAYYSRLAAPRNRLGDEWADEPTLEAMYETKEGPTRRDRPATPHGEANYYADDRQQQQQQFEAFLRSRYPLDVGGAPPRGGAPPEVWHGSNAPPSAHTPPWRRLSSYGAGAGGGPDGVAGEYYRPPMAGGWDDAGRGAATLHGAPDSWPPRGTVGPGAVGGPLHDPYGAGTSAGQQPHPVPSATAPDTSAMTSLDGASGYETVHTRTMTAAMPPDFGPHSDGGGTVSIDKPAADRDGEGTTSHPQEGGGSPAPPSSGADADMNHPSNSGSPHTRAGAGSPSAADGSGAWPIPPGVPPLPLGSPQFPPRQGMSSSPTGASPRQHSSTSVRSHGGPAGMSPTSATGTPRMVAGNRSLARKPKPKGALDSPRAPLDVIKQAATLVSKQQQQQQQNSDSFESPQRANTEPDIRQQQQQHQQQQQRPGQREGSAFNGAHSAEAMDYRQRHAVPQSSTSTRSRVVGFSATEGGREGDRHAPMRRPSSEGAASSPSLQAIAASVDKMLSDHQRILDEVLDRKKRGPASARGGRQGGGQSANDSGEGGSGDTRSGSTATTTTATDTTSSEEVDEMLVLSRLRRQVDTMDRDVERVQATLADPRLLLDGTSHEDADAHRYEDDMGDSDGASAPGHAGGHSRAGSKTATTTRRAAASRRARGEMPDAVVRRLLSYQVNQAECLAYNEKTWNTSTVSQYVFAQRLTGALLEDCLDEVTREVNSIMDEYVDGLADHELQ